jgi:integrase
MRPGELCAMRSGDIDTVGSVWIYRPRRHKTEHHDHEREIRLGPRAQRILRPLLKADLAAHIFAPAQAEAERHRRQREQRKTPLTPSQLARAERARRRQRRRPPQDHWSVASYRRAIARACDRADELARAQAGAADGQRIIPRWHPHQLRHNFATAIRRDYGPEAALVLLGDRTTRMIDVYAEKDRATAEQIIAAVG